MRIKVLIFIMLIVFAGGLFLLLYVAPHGVNHSKDVIEAKEKNPVQTEAKAVSTHENDQGVKLDADKGPLVRIVAVGDILLGRGVSWWVESQKRGYTYPFEKVTDILKKGDVVFGNLEESITDSTHSLDGIENGGKYVLSNKTKAFEGIKYAGFNLLNLANNHILDYYDRGLYDTITILDKNGIAHAGAGRNLDEARKLAIIEKNNMKIGLLSYTDMAEAIYKGKPPLKFSAGKDKAGVAPRIYKYIKEDVREARGKVDILIVSFHWGKEGSFDILPEQTELSYELLDDGVDIILGHHPHQFQGIEFYKGKPIIYSMGNFIFDQNDPVHQESFIVDMEYQDNRITGMSLIPVRTVKKSQIVPQTGSNAATLLKREVNLCTKLGVKCHIESDKVVFDLH